MSAGRLASEVGQGSAEGTPEHRLWTAVIARTVQDWLSGSRRFQLEAETFLFHDEKDFPGVCQAASIDPATLRSKLARLKKSGYGPADRLWRA